MTTTEGWGVRRKGDRVYHYYNNGTSLCNRVMFYAGPLDPDDGGPKQKDDCAKCYGLMQKRLRVISYEQ